MLTIKYVLRHQVFSTNHICYYKQGGHFPDHMKFPDFSSSLDR